MVAGVVSPYIGAHQCMHSIHLVNVTSNNMLYPGFSS